MNAPEQAVDDVLTELGWEHARVADDTWQAQAPTEHGLVPALVYHHGETQTLLFYLLFPMRVPETGRLGAAEYLTRANRGLRLGAFELGWDEGEVRYRVGLDYEGGDPAIGLRNAIGDALVMYEQYHDGLLACVWGGKAPAEAVAAAERGEVAEGTPEA